ncbi:MAG: glycosyltransferase [Actinomycetota bacterium]
MPSSPHTVSDPAVHPVRPVRSPVAVGGVGGSGTRAVAEILRATGVDTGPDLNRSGDNLWFTLLFSRPRWLRGMLHGDRAPVGPGLDLFVRAMEGRLDPGPADLLHLGRATADVFRHGHNDRGDGRGTWALDRARSLLREGRRPRTAPRGWGWKEPATYLLLEALVRDLVDLRYVHVLRHGLDAALGPNTQHVETFAPLFGISADPSPRSALRYWLAANEHTERAAAELGERALVLRFEDLCSRPREEVDRLLAFLRIDAEAPERERLSRIPVAPPSIGRHRDTDLSVFDPRDVERVRALGFAVGPSRRRRRPRVRFSSALSAGSPTLSVAICTFDGERYLSAQLASIAAQRVSPNELVACDDGSTDGTLDLLRRFAADAPYPVRILEGSGRRLGPAANFGRAIEASTQEVIVLSDQDDEWRPDRLERTHDAFAEDDALALLCSDADLIDETSASLGEGLWDALATGRDRQRFEAGDPADRVQVLSERNLMTGATMAVRSAYRDLILPIPPGWVHDAWIGLLLAATARVRLIPEPLVRYRVHGEQQIGLGTPPPPARTAVIGRARHALRRMTRPERAELEREARAFGDARDRLAERAGRHPVPASALALLRDKAEHFGARARMAEGRGRWRAVRSELTAGRYHRFSRGWASAVKDLLLLDRYGTP